MVAATRGLVPRVDWGRGGPFEVERTTRVAGGGFAGEAGRDTGLSLVRRRLEDETADLVDETGVVLVVTFARGLVGGGGCF